MKVGLTVGGIGYAKIRAGLEMLDGADVVVGIPQEKSSRKKGNINNAELLFIFTNGSPLRGQPPRVVIEAAIMAEPTQSLIAKELALAASAALVGNEGDMVRHLNRAGTIAESASKKWFTDSRNQWAPNAPSTINRKLERLTPKQAEKAIDAIIAAGGDTAGIITPGIMSGQMRRAITHVVNAQGLNGDEDNAKDLDENSKIKWSSEVDPEAAEGEAGAGEGLAEVALL